MSIEELQSTLVVHEQKFKKNEKEEEHALRIDTGDSTSVARGRGIVKLGNNTRMTVEGKGNIKLVLSGVTYVIKESDVCKVFHPEKGLVFQSKMSTNRMYPLSEDTYTAADQKTFDCLYSSDDEIAKLWHERLGHISHTSMKTLQTKCMVRDLPKFTIGESICEDCVMGKQTREAIPKVETETGKVVKALRTDRGGEYLSNEFVSFCREHGIKRQLTTSFTPQQNGVAKRKNRTVINMVVTLLSAKNMPKMFWAEATCWSFYVLNRSTTKALSDMTPQEAWSGLKPTVNHFCVWGCLTYVHVPKEKQTKLEKKSVVCVLIGISEESKAYRLINPETIKAITSRDVIFEENKEWNWNQSKKNNVVDEDLSWGNYDFIDED
nr:putative RNA-directed DNA polymerase [Tanacetum cinerariifolium]